MIPDSLTLGMEFFEGKVIQLKGNKLLMGSISLENLFDCEDVRNDKQRFMENEKDYEELDVRNGRRLKVEKEVLTKDKEILRDMCYEYDGVMAWNYDDNRCYDPSIIQHTIDFEDELKPIRQKQRPVNPNIEALMVQELTKLAESKIIYPIKDSTWVSNLVLI